MKQQLTQDKIISKVKLWAAKEATTPILLISQEDGSYHIGYYAGMGNYDHTPIDKLPLIYKEVIEQFYNLGYLQEAGKPFMIYPGGYHFKKLVLNKNNKLP
ncbi:hypothetical protein [Pseudoalteromonas sp. T1lg75]|uniref:hypothetical protein n=1 Tax=Pseudoalteromonas sp. T1lg75 TaxID=2077102 RepID=UPI000CF703B0|nr:hypothetical protein [Pseudoalteromonas sp. T1lg75]